MNILSEICCVCGLIMMIVGLVKGDAYWEVAGGFISVISLLMLILSKI